MADEVAERVERCTSHTEQVKIELLKFICQSAMLLSLCRIPAICSMVCSYLQQTLQSNRKLDTIPNLTKLYLGIFKMFILRNSNEYHDIIPSFKDFSLQQNLFRFAQITMQEFLATWYMVKGKDLYLKDIKALF